MVETVKILPSSEEPEWVLVVDDEVAICEILKDFLEYEGFKVTTCHTGEEAIVLLGKQPYAIMLTDLKMPGMGGINLLKHLTQSEHDTVAIIMTGYGTVQTAIDAMKIGAFDYILKPFKPEEVVQVLRRGIEKRKLERENFELRQSIGFYKLSEALSSTMPIDQQLNMIVALVAENFGIPCVELVIENPDSPGHHITIASRGPTGFRPRIDLLMTKAVAGDPVLVHGDKLNEYLQSPVTSEHTVRCFMSAPLRIRGAPIGVLNAYGLGSHNFSEGQRKGLSVFAGRAANAIDVSRMYGNLANTFTQTIEGFARALEAKDHYTAGHSDRVAMYAFEIANVLGLPAVDCRRVQHGGLMHDIGKMGIRSADLNKPQKLSPAEYTMFKSHPVLGKRIIEPINFLTHLVPCVYHHHETWDGTGYPQGLGGNDIPIDARILAVADSYDAMTSDRPYRKALPHEVALAELKRCAKRQFDPDPVDAFLSMIEDFRREMRDHDLLIPD